MADANLSQIQAIANSSPLICLSKAELQDLLGKLYSKVLVPVPVLNEIAQGKDGDRILRIVQSSSWAEIIKVEIFPEILEWNLESGEGSVISQAVKEPNLEILIDDRLANRCARLYQLKTRGTLGILLLAKRKGVIAELRPSMERIMQAGL